MKFLVIGGDERSVRLVGLLCARGHEVRCMALEQARLPEAAAAYIEGERFDCAVLPLPVQQGRSGILNAPYGARPQCLNTVLRALPEGSLICGGKISAELRELAEARSLRLFDVMARPRFTVGNAAITAEGALYALMRHMDGTLLGGRVLVIGYGRIGRILAGRLLALGADTWVLSRNPEAAAMAEAALCRALTPEAPPECFSGFDAVINTAPAQVLQEGALRALPEGTLLLELASAPGGFDAAAAEALGLKYAAAPGLPGKYAPQSAAKLLLDEVLSIVKENEQ